jgi:hypothetical protein
MLGVGTTLTVGDESGGDGGDGVPDETPDQASRRGEGRASA